MAQLVSNDDTQRCLRDCLQKEGFKLTARKQHGETGVDLIADKGEETYFIEVVGFKKSGSARAKDFYEVFFRAVSRIKYGAEKIVIALPKRFGDGLNQRASIYGEAWKRIGNAFPELEIWLIDSGQSYSYERTSWNSWLHASGEVPKALIGKKAKEGRSYLDADQEKKICPECGRRFQGKGFEGIDAHWRARHEQDKNIMPYKKGVAAN